MPPVAAVRDTILAIIIGAQEWPQAPALEGSKVFENSAHDFEAYLLEEHGFNLSPDNVLNLFDSNSSVNEIDEKIDAFLDKRCRAMKDAGARLSDLLVYYVGHGEKIGNFEDLGLAVRVTRT